MKVSDGFDEKVNGDSLRGSAGVWGQVFLGHKICLVVLCLKCFKFKYVLIRLFTHRQADKVGRYTRLGLDLHSFYK
jgi:hypothetical protein